MSFFNLNWIEGRDAKARESYELVRRIMRKNGEWRNYLNHQSRLEARGETARDLRDATNEDGITGIVESGMDCDCSQYCWPSTHRFAGVFAFEKFCDDAYAGSDGRHYVSLCHPDELPGGYSRDLALEAFEDGHAHIVSTVRFDEEGSY